MASRGRKRISVPSASSKQKQLAGILLLLLTFAALCYAIVTIANEGLLNLQFGQGTPVSETINSSKTTTTVAVIYTNATNSS